MRYHLVTAEHNLLATQFVIESFFRGHRDGSFLLGRKANLFSVTHERELKIENSFKRLQLIDRSISSPHLYSPFSVLLHKQPEVPGKKKDVSMSLRVQRKSFAAVSIRYSRMTQ